MKHILVIDDDAGLRTVLAKALRDAGYTVTVATDGKDGLAQFHTVKPDLVLTDLIMPVKEGIEVIIELRRTHPQTRIIAMSSGGERGHSAYLELAGALGAVRTLKKPFSVDELLAAVAEVPA